MDYPGERQTISCRQERETDQTDSLETRNTESADIKQDAKGNIYLATKNDGVYLLKAGSTVFTKIAGIGNLPIESIYISRDQRLFIGCDGMGIFVYNPITGFLQNNPLFSREVNLAKSKVTSIIEDFTGNIWVSMLQKGVFMQSQAQYDFNYMGYRLGNRNVIGENSITSLCANQGNQVWVGTDKDGLYLFDLKTGSINSHLLSNTTVLALCKDQKSRTWVGTYTDGIGFIDAGGLSIHSALALAIRRASSIFRKTRRAIYGLPPWAKDSPPFSRWEHQAVESTIWCR